MDLSLFDFLMLILGSENLPFLASICNVKIEKFFFMS